MLEKKSSLFLPKVRDDFESHKALNDEAGKVGQSPGRLRHLVQVDKGVEVSGTSEDPEAPVGRGIGRVGEEVEPGNDEVQEDVLHIVLMSSPHPLHVLVVKPDLALDTLGILVIGKDLIMVVVYSVLTQKSHDSRSC